MFFGNSTNWGRRPRLFCLAVVLISHVGCGVMKEFRAKLHGNSSEGEYTRSHAGSRLGTPKTDGIKALPGLDLTVTPEVSAQLNRYMTWDRGTIREMLTEKKESFGPLKRLLRSKGVPEELVSVAAVESRLNQYATSPAGARGLWQFMRRTAQSYGLEVSRRKDERLDVTRSTLAAAQHMRDLFYDYEDWYLTLAAYNAGRTAINRKLRRSQMDGFWELAHAGELSKETKQFVPRVIAMTLILNNPSRYGF